MDRPESLNVAPQAPCTYDEARSVAPDHKSEATPASGADSAHRPTGEDQRNGEHLVPAQPARATPSAYFCPRGYGECEDAGGCVYPGRCRSAAAWLTSPHVTATLARFRAEDRALAALHSAHVDAWIDAVTTEEKA